MTLPRTPRARLYAGLLAIVVAGAVSTVTRGSDHVDTAEVELSPRLDLNDVYAFPGSNENRIVLVMTVGSPIQRVSPQSFDPNALYQLKIDNTGDAVDDLVLQFTFEGTGADQTVRVRGPVEPRDTGMVNRLVEVDPAVSGRINTVLGSANGMQVFAGVRDDPFFIDFEQFVRILPDRRPATGPLSEIETQQATSFRDPGVNFFAGANGLAIVVELPESRLTGGGNGTIGVWATISR